MRKFLAIVVLVIATACAEDRRPESAANLIDEYFAAYDHEDSVTMTLLCGWPASNSSRIGQQMAFRRKYGPTVHREAPLEHEPSDTTDAGMVRHYRVAFELENAVATAIFAIQTDADGEDGRIVESRIGFTEKEPRESMKEKE
jgi:hypothetical protein